MSRKEHRDGAKLGTLTAAGYEVSLEDHRLAVMKGETTIVARGIEHLIKGGRWSDSGLKGWLKGHGYNLEEQTDTAVIYSGDIVRDDGTRPLQEELTRLLRMFLVTPDPQLALDLTDEEEAVVAIESEAEPWRWLASTYRLQTETYGYPLNEFADRVRDSQGSVDLGTVASYLDWNATAAAQEIAEVREEFSWKPWATDKPFVNRDRIRDEVIDALHFLGNILTGIGVTDEELAQAYQAKQERNRARQASGTYSARKGGLAEGSDV